MKYTKEFLSVKLPALFGFTTTSQFDPNSPKVLTQEYQQSSLVTLFEDRVKSFSMADPFFCYHPLNPDNGPEIYDEAPVNLFRDHDRVDIGRVSDHTRCLVEWYDNADTLLTTDCVLTGQYLMANMKPGLQIKVREGLASFPEHIQTCGPVIWKTMMALITCNNDEYADNVFETIKNYQIKKQPGQVIPKITSVILNGWARILEIKGYLPRRSMFFSLRFLQTTDVDMFNEHHKNLQHQYMAETIRRPFERNPGQHALLTDTYDSIEMVFRRADAYYYELEQTGYWASQVRSKPPKGAFNAADNSSSGGTKSSNAPKNKCFNCGSDKHRLADCDKAIDDAKVAKNKKAWMDAKEKSNEKSETSGSSSGKK